MRTVLEPFFAGMICCPLCKANLKLSPNTFICYNCGTEFRKKGGIPDFRLIAPEYARSSAQAQWLEGQKGFEEYATNVSLNDRIDFFLAEIDSVQEIYTQHFMPFYGSLLDVGGSRGTLRHFLNPSVKYLVIDPQIDAFEGIELQSGLMHAYPFLSQPCNFLAGFAEHLPLTSCQFDFVHMRSVIDHFFDPVLSIKEAFRVLKDDGRLMIGVSTYSPEAKEPIFRFKLMHKLQRANFVIRNEGVSGLIARLRNRFSFESDHHMWKWEKDDLLDLIGKCGFVVDKMVQQKPPFEYCIYML